MTGLARLSDGAVGRFIHPPKLPLIRDGRLVWESLRSELMLEEEVMTQLRLNGLEKLNEVRAAYMEGNGQVSVLKTQSDGDSGAKPQQNSLTGG